LGESQKEEKRYMFCIPLSIRFGMSSPKISLH
jgi:hypothetical protein